MLSSHKNGLLIMKKIFTIISAAFLILSCSKEYDDSSVNSKLDNLENRVSTLEAQVKQMNSNITAYKNDSQWGHFPNIEELTE